MAVFGGTALKRRLRGAAGELAYEFLPSSAIADPGRFAPGLVEGTRMALRLPDEVSAGARRQAVLGKVGSATDIADATVLLCRADTITGQTIVVDGGMPGAMNFG